MRGWWRPQACEMTRPHPDDTGCFQHLFVLAMAAGGQGRRLEKPIGLGSHGEVGCSSQGGGGVRRMVDRDL